MTSLRAPTILVVEDNDITRKMVRKTLEAEGYTVVEAADGRSALSLIRERRPDLVLQDLRLPDMDGFELVARLRGTPEGAGTPILAFSGYQSRVEEAQAGALGFNDFLVKPVEPSRLLLAVQAYLPHGERSAGPVSESPGKGRRVLLVDDDAVQLKLGGVLLRQLGFEVEMAAGAEEGIEKLRGASVDAIVTDTMMPHVDGFRFCMLIREIPHLRQVPVVMVSSVYLDAPDRELARMAGANAFVLRTSNFREVIDALLKALEGGPPPPVEEVSWKVKEEHTQRVIQQLERQVAKNADLAQRAALQATALSILSAISDAMSKQQDIAETMQVIVSQCMDAAGISRGVLYQAEADGRLVLRTCHGYPRGAREAVDAVFGQGDLARRLLAEGSPAALPSRLPAPAEEAVLLGRAAARSALVIPLLSQGERMGLLFLASEVTDLTADYWIPFAHTMSAQLGQALALTRAFARVVSSERRYRALLEHAEDAIIVTDPDDNLLEVNRRAEALLGARAPSLIGRSMSEIVPASERERLAAIREQLHREGKARVTDLTVRSLDGRSVPVDGSLAAVELNGEWVTLAIFRDITEQKRVQVQLLVSDRMASVGLLAAGVAHEINNPLAAVIANLEFAVRDVEAMKQPGQTGAVDLAEVLHDAREAAERVRQIVRDLKTFSRSEDENRGLVDVQRVIESSLRMAWNEIRHRARLEKRFEKIPAVEANESRLGQVFLNLLVNAAQALPEGHADQNLIRVSTGVDESGRVIVEIADSGAGMSQEVIARLFTPFFTTKPIGVGTGLGLSICQRIVSSLGGGISVVSGNGKGTTFRVALPPAGQAVHAEGTERPGPTPPSRRGRVLVVDDEPMITKVVGRTLGADHEVEIVGRAAEALERIAGGARFDVILCDLMMPEMTGMDLHGELHRVAPDQARKMVFLTGGAFTSRARAFLDEVPNQRVEKPFDTQNLRALVNERLR